MFTVVWLICTSDHFLLMLFNLALIWLLIRCTSDCRYALIQACQSINGFFVFLHATYTF